MPFLDVSRVLASPMFADTISVIRRKETVNDYGESTVTTTTMHSISAVVTSGGSALDRGPDQQNAPNTITVHTTFRLRGPAPGYQPDLVVWRGDSYIVAKVNDYSNFGAGFVAAECSSIDTIDQAPT